jgi:hypothetical protein
MQFQRSLDDFMKIRSCRKVSVSCLMGSFFGVCLIFQGHVSAESIEFNRDIRPILAAECLHCHGHDPKLRKADLRLDERAGLYAETKDGFIIDRKKPEQSLLLQRILTEDPDDRMPPPESKKSLSEEKISMIRQWIMEGAEWQDHWAFVAPKNPTLPEVAEEAWIGNPIDRFVYSELDQHGLIPSAAADRRTLMRRVNFDLTGLPPTPEEVEAFVSDTGPNAFEKVVDRLLNSERYGERMTLAWMDAARYGDSSVFHADGVRDMWPWRDWVIRAYNSNMPFDQFTVEQLAGDLLPGSTRNQKIASGFNRNHGTTDEGGAIDEEYRVEYMVDRVKTTSNVWLGLSMECAQCHDHKYDPISQKEYYQFYAFFNRSKDRGMQTRNGNAPPLVYLYDPMQEAQVDHFGQQIAGLKENRKRVQPTQGEMSSWAALERAKGLHKKPALGAWMESEPFSETGFDQSFDRDFGPETKKDWAAVKESGNWEPAEDWKDGKPITLSLPDFHSLYAARVIQSEDAMEIDVSLGSDDALKVWLNGEELLSRKVVRGVAADQETVRLKLKPGENLFLAKIINSGGGSGFYFKLGGPRIPLKIVGLLKIKEGESTEEDSTALTEYYSKKVWPVGLKLNEEIQSLEKQQKDIRDSVTTCMVMEDMEKPRATYVLSRGHYASPVKDEEILPGVPAFLPTMPEGVPSNRLGLARWLTLPNHPLTARVTVNRYWQMLFGSGLVSTVSDLGTRGDWPSHMNLLDWLARDFIDHGWNVKRTLKQMVMSSTYRQQSNFTPESRQKDPENILLSRGPRFRLQGEFIRDNVLMLSGLLNAHVGGPSTKPYQPPRIWNEVSLDGNLKYVRDKGDKLYRRSMYIYWKRSAPSPSMMAFDAPTREKCLIQRQRTNTPLQALVILNDVQFVEAARVFAERIMKNGGASIEEKIRYAFLHAVGRPADKLRTQVMTHLYQEQLEAFRQEPERAEALLEFGEFESDDRLDPAEHAALTTLANALFNLDEVLTKE